MKINAISGMPRSGTSTAARLIAQTGVPFVGEAFNTDSPGPSLKELNPLGYYETDFTSRGWSGQVPGVLEGSWAKIVASGLCVSNPDLIDKVIYMARSPRDQAASMVKMAIASKRVPQPPNPRRYLLATGRVAEWFVLNGKTPLVVDFDALLLDPAAECFRMSEYAGLSVVPDRVDPAISRNQGAGADIPDTHWRRAEKVHQLILAGDWEAVYAQHVMRSR